MNYRLYIVVIVFIVTLLAGVSFYLVPDRESTRPLLLTDTEELPRQMQIRLDFNQGVVALQERRFEDAVAAFHDVLSRAPQLPEAHVNLGFALLGKQQFGAAADFFYSATSLRPSQANAYYGLAVALEQMEDLSGAVGAMRTYLHLADRNSPFIVKARAALWEWQDRTGVSGGAVATQSSTQIQEKLLE